MENKLKITDEIQTLIKFLSKDDEIKALEVKELYGINIIQKKSENYSWHIISNILELSYFSRDLGLNGVTFVLGSSNFEL